MLSTVSKPWMRAGSRWASPAMGTAMVLTVLAAIAIAADSQPNGPSEEAAIRAAIESYVADYNARDAKAVAEHWSENAEWISPSGERFQGRQAIEQQMEVLFAENKDMKIEVIDPTVRLIAADAALEEGTVRVLRPGEPPSDATYVAVHAKKDGQWKLECVRETSLPARTLPHQQLKPLEWLVGEWIDESPDAVVEHRCQWSEDGSYLLGQFVVQWQGQPAMKGDIRIGWDPLRQQIRSWVFDSEGGYAEGVWTQVGDGWVVKMTGVQPDGGTASATTTYVPLRRDQYQYTSMDRIVAGQQEPDQTARIVRKPPQPKDQ